MGKAIEWGVWLLCAALTGCTTANMRAYEPVRVKTKYSQGELTSAARWALEDAGYVTLTSESEAHTILTRDKEVFTSSVPRMAYRYSFRVGTQGGTLTIHATCEQNSAMDRQTYEDCGAERPERVSLEQERVREAILRRAEKKSAKN